MSTGTLRSVSAASGALLAGRILEQISLKVVPFILSFYSRRAEAISVRISTDQTSDKLDGESGT